MMESTNNFILSMSQNCYKEKNFKPADIKPKVEPTYLDAGRYSGISGTFTDNAFKRKDISRLVGMSETFIGKVIGPKSRLSLSDVLFLLDMDAYGETFIKRSKIIDFLINNLGRERNRPGDEKAGIALDASDAKFIVGNSVHEIKKMPRESVNCVVTSTPYWGMRLYKESMPVSWADGEECPFGHEQTPDAFVRHSVEILWLLYRILAEDGSIWWNIMDSFNTRTQIRASASETLTAMNGKDIRGWGDYECRRYSSGHSYLKDGEQCMIPAKIAERASKIGFYVKSLITWAKTNALPEPQGSRVSRNLEYVIHLTKSRTPKFDKTAYRSLPPSLGGRNAGESDKLSDVWIMSPSSGGNGHGAQFPISLPARCVALSTKAGDLVLDPFVGLGNSALAALALKRKFIGIDSSKEYIEMAIKRSCENQGSLLSPAN